MGKLTCNQEFDWKQLSQFVSTSDEAFAMLVLEHNARKWMYEVTYPDIRMRGEKVKSLYTEGGRGRQWTKKGRTRFVEIDVKMKQVRGIGAAGEVNEVNRDRWMDI